MEYLHLTTADESTMTATKEYTREDVALRDGKNGNPTWIIIRDMVYDVTDYLDEHPGGPELVTDFAGRDGTKDFDDFGHSGAAMELLKKFKIGELNYVSEILIFCPPHCYDLICSSLSIARMPISGSRSR